MYAVIETGGKQYRVQPGDFLQIEKLGGDLGSSLTFDQILFWSEGNPDQPKISLGKPYISGASVQAEIVGIGRGEKIVIVKMKRRKQYRRVQGHRQEYVQVLVTGINNGEGSEAVLQDEDKKKKLSTFQSHLKVKGPSQSAPKLGSRKRLAAQARSSASASQEKSAV